MKKDSLFKNLVEALNDRIPQRGKLADELTELLGIEKEAVYRRLRGSVPFSFHEIHTIARRFGFSLDSISENISLINRQMTVEIIDVLEPKESDYQRLEDFADGFLRLHDDFDSEVGAIGSVIPSSLYMSYEYMYKFYLFKWSYQFGSTHKIKTYAETNPTERLKQINRYFVENIQNCPHGNYILDRSLIEHFVKDVHFFLDIRLITEEDVLLLKNDSHLLLNDLERYAINGCFDTGCRVDIFLANIHIDTDYNFIDSSTYKITTMRSFAFSDSYSLDEVVFRNMKNWLNFLKRTSTLISQGNIPERIRFFDQQRKLVEAM